MEGRDFRNQGDGFSDGGQPPVDFKALQKFLGSAWAWVALAALVLAVFLFSSIRIGRVSGEQVGLLLNKLNGKITVIEQSGVQIYNGITSEFYVLDRTLQTLEMIGEDSLKIKTVDGSDVYVDLKVQYKISPDLADTVITTSGPGDQYKKKWTYDYVRSLCRNHLGELTTEEFYDSSMRNVKVLGAQQEAGARLSRFGILIDSIVIPQKPRFYKEYEAMIKKKKLADQAVLEERSKALAAKQRQIKLEVEKTNEKNVIIKKFEGDMRRKIIEAEAAGEKARKQADAQYDKLTIGAEAALYKMQKDAEGILARKTAEAQGILALKKALEGEGGRNMVMLEYARRLKNITFIGQPFTIQGHTERFEHLTPAAAGRGAGRKK